MLSYLTFSDSAKFAQAALNSINSGSLAITHSFFDTNILNLYKQGNLFPVNFPPATSILLSYIFRFFPATDTTIALSGLTLFFLSATLIFFIGKKIHSYKVGFISAIFFLLNPFFQEYALNFSTEILFIFLLLSFVFVFLLQGKAKILSLIPLFLTIYTRQQSIILFAGIIITFLFFFLRGKTDNSKKLSLFLGLLVLVAIVIFFSLSHSGSIISPAKVLGSLNIKAGSNFGSYIRGGGYQTLSSPQILSKIFYNTYNFIKSPARLTSPIIIFMFIYSLFLKQKNKNYSLFQVFTLLSFLGLILASSATLPNARYVHPIIPLVTISASVGLVEILKNISSAKLRQVATLATVGFIIFPSIGNMSLDARSRHQQLNTDKPPVYRQIARVMAQDIPPQKLIITNLDAWASWYEGLTTMWFPLSPDMLNGFEDKISYIVITNYKENDADFALNNWREIVYNPQHITNQFISENYNVLKTFTIKPNQVYENKNYRGTILIKKEK